MEIKTKFSIGDKAFYFRHYSDSGELYQIVPVVVGSITIRENGQVEYYSSKTFLQVPEKDLLTPEEAVKKFTEIAVV